MNAARAEVDALIDDFLADAFGRTRSNSPFIRERLLAIAAAGSVAKEDDAARGLLDEVNDCRCGCDAYDGLLCEWHRSDLGIRVYEFLTGEAAPWRHVLEVAAARKTGGAA